MQTLKKNNGEYILKAYVKLFMQKASSLYPGNGWKEQSPPNGLPDPGDGKPLIVPTTQYLQNWQSD